MRLAVVLIFLISLSVYGQEDSLVSKKHRSKFGISFSLNYSNITKSSVNQTIPDVIKPNVADNHRGRKGFSIDIYNQFFLREKLNLLVGVYVGDEGYQSKEVKHNYYDFPRADSDTLFPDDKTISTKFKNRYNFVGISFGLKNNLLGKRSFFYEFGITPKFLIAAYSGLEGIGGNVYVSEYKKWNFDMFLSFGYKMKQGEGVLLELLPSFRYSFISESGLPYHGNLWNVGLKLRYAFGFKE